ncbi:MAG: hypothetical protein GY830_05040, partial [Bacteroidetes bacterium]|nr:hypothetical protein [Bacteroidota bacterium]
KIQQYLEKNQFDEWQDIYDDINNGYDDCCCKIILFECLNIQNIKEKTRVYNILKNCLSEDLDCLDERFGNNHIGIYKFNIILNNDLQHKYKNKKIKKASEDDKINSESKSEEKEGINSESKSEEKEGINSESKSEEKEEIKCLICKKFLDPYIRILKCGHKIHRNCVNNWINTKSVCSLCKAKPKKETTYTFEIDGNERMVLPLGYKNIGPLYTYGVDNISPKHEYENLKDEVLNNKYAPISGKTWNGILRKCNKILKGGFSSRGKKISSKNLRDNNIRLNHLVALKLYTDLDVLQKEFRKSFRKPYHKEERRSQSFYWWRKTLMESYENFNIMLRNTPCPINLFHGVNHIAGIEQDDNNYHTFYGPFSTTSDLHVARSFAGKMGMILQIKPEAFVPSAIYEDMNKIYCQKDIDLIKGWLKNDKNYINIIPKTFHLENKINTIIACYYHKPRGALDISWISDFPAEREYLMFNSSIELRTWVLSSDYDQHYHYYHALFIKNLKKLKVPSGHLSYENQIKVLPRLKKLKACIEKVNIKNFSPLKKGYKDKKEVC